MKHTIIKTLLAILFLLPAWSFAQDKAIAKIFDEYSGKSGYTSVDISKGLFQLFAQLEADDPEFDDLQKALDGLESLRLVAYSIEGDKGTTEEKNSFVSNIKSTVPFDEFKELMVVRDGDDKINFYAKSEGQIITEMIMLVDGADKAVFLSLFGVIDLKHIAKLGSTMDLGGMEYLGKMKSE